MKHNRRNVRFGLLALCFFASAHFLTPVAQPFRQIPVRWCTANFDTSKCFRDLQKTYEVGSQVGYLGDLYKFCFNVDTINVGKTRPVRVILTIDQSSSMCASGQQNDPTDQRILAAHLFLDSLAKNSPTSEVGVVRFFAWMSNKVYQTFWLSAKPLTSQANIATLHRFIDSAACTIPTGYPLGKAVAVEQIKKTDIGHALDKALSLANDNVPSTHDRHVILLTDGEWDDSLDVGTYGEKYDPASIVERYSKLRPPPFVHSIYLHAPGPADLSKLELVSKLTGGRFFGNVQASEIVAKFQDLLNSMIEINAERLERISFRRLGTTERDDGVVVPVGVSEFNVTLPRLWELKPGLNQIIIEQHVSSKSGNIILYDTLRITRLDRELAQSEISGYSVSCKLDTALMTLVASTNEVIGRVPIGIKASVPDNATNTDSRQAMFLQDLSTVYVRTVTAFPNNDPGRNYQLVYHVDGTLQEADGKAAGTGTPVFSTLRGAFGRHIESGSFSVTIAPLQLVADFTVEAWIKPVAESQAFAIFSGPFTLQVTASGVLELSMDGKKIATNGKIDRAVWQHVAVARSGGNVNIYVNGIPAGTASNITTAVAGTLTIGAATGGAIDEVRISNKMVSRRLSNGIDALDLPLAADITWYVPTESSSPEAQVNVSDWLKDPPNVSFRVSAPERSDILVNVVHAPGSDTKLTWSKMTDPLRFAPTDTLGPRVTSARFHPGPRPTTPGSGEFPDTLYIVYSEPVNCTELYAGSPKEIYDFADSDGAGNPLDRAVFKSTNCAAGFVVADTLIIAQGGSRIQPDFDSLRLAPGKVSDTYGNKSEAAAVKTLIIWGVDLTIPPYAHQNPITVGPSGRGTQDQIPEQLRANVTKIDGSPAAPGDIPLFGVAIIKKTVQPLREGFVTIYDPVGNMVLNRSPMYRKSTDNNLYFFWDGRNISDRYVGSGTYVAVIECTRTNNSQEKSRIKIGVKR